MSVSLPFAQRRVRIRNERKKQPVCSGGPHSAGEMAHRQMATMRGGRCCLLTREESMVLPGTGEGPMRPRGSIWPLWEAVWDLEGAALTWAPVWGGGGCRQEGQVGRLTGAWGPSGRTVCLHLLCKVHAGVQAWQVLKNRSRGYC